MVPEGSFSDGPVANLPAKVQTQGKQENFQGSKLVILLECGVRDQTPSEEMDSKRREGM